MSDVFLSYKREDKDRVMPLRDALIAEAVTVWWDGDTGAGEEWGPEIERQLNEARAVLVVWSTASVGPKGAFVRDEARRGLADGKLLPVQIEAVSPPIGFGEYQALDLVGWTGRLRDPRFVDVLAAVRALVSGGSRPPPRWPSIRRRRRLFAFAGTTPFAVALTLLLSPDAQRGVCRVPGLSSLCRWAKIGQSCKQVESVTWAPKSEHLPEVVRAGAPFPTEEAARVDAIARGEAEVREVLCASYEAGDWQLVTATVSAGRWNCTPSAAGVACGFEGKARCDVKQKVITMLEKCSP